MTATNPSFSAFALMKGVCAACIFPRRSWVALSAERPSDRIVCLSIILVLAGVRAGYPLLVYTKRLLVGPLPQEVTSLMGVVADSLVDGLLLIIGILLAAETVRFLAPQFQGTASRNQALKLVTYSSIPVLLASGVGALSAHSIFSIWFWAWHLVVWSWSAVLLHEGTRVMTTIDRAKRFSFLTAFLASMLILYLTLGALSIFLKAR